MKKETTALAEDIMNDYVEVRLGSIMSLITMASNMVQTLTEANHKDAEHYRNQFNQWASNK